MYRDGCNDMLDVAFVEENVAGLKAQVIHLTLAYQFSI